MTVRIYADFNGIESIEGNPSLVTVRLDTMGSLRDLCIAHIRLENGLRLRFYADSDGDHDLEVDGTVRWQTHANALWGGYWTADFVNSELQDYPWPVASGETSRLPCFACGTDLMSSVREIGLTAESRCGVCGTLVHTPILPP